MLLLTILFTTTLILQTSAQCNVCGDVSKAACLSEDQYYKCVNGFAVLTSILTCPTGKICRNVAGICDNAPSYPSCKICGVCTAPDGYTCLSENTYSPCLNGSSINWPVTCPVNQRCHPTGTNGTPCTTLTVAQTQRCPNTV